MTWLGILGFLVMLASATLGLAAWRGQHPAAEPTESETLYGLDERSFSVIEGGRSADKKSRRFRNKPFHRPHNKAQGQAPHKPQGTFMQRMEQRWERRRNQGW